MASFITDTDFRLKNPFFPAIAGRLVRGVAVFYRLFFFKFNDLLTSLRHLIPSSLTCLDTTSQDGDFNVLFSCLYMY